MSPASEEEMVNFGPQRDDQLETSSQDVLLTSPKEVTTSASPGPLDHNPPESLDKESLGFWQNFVQGFWQNFVPYKVSPEPLDREPLNKVSPEPLDKVSAKAFRAVSPTFQDEVLPPKVTPISSSGGSNSKAMPVMSTNPPARKSDSHTVMNFNLATSGKKKTGGSQAL